MAHINICGNWGTLVVNAETGEVEDHHLNGSGYQHIKKFDIAEYTKAYGQPPVGDLDILDLGYWAGDGTYIEADEYHREMTGTGWSPIIANEATGRVLQ
ncbi:hypothetical protein [Mesorhizobium sp. STM 4661]|uniref:hypothetical protein n=1 Tax=Mesorhizobium sp. STM 4661 TaxID=1297570 RepID=UPI0002BEE121|nr:hypothetical protein [Mesorhizobium sp. STM 4661]CCV12976.1 conserved hypothetical protein [Mesorhizobium sp. STM 4661]